MQSTFRLRFCAWLFVFLICGCGTKNEVADKKDDLSFGELVAKAHFVAKELHFNMQSGIDQQFNTSVFEAFKEQLEGIAGNASASDLSKKQQGDLIDACNFLALKSISTLARSAAVIGRCFIVTIIAKFVR